MRPSRVLSFVAASSLCAALGVHLRAQDPAPRPARMLEITAVALDRANNLVQDLTQADLEVWIGGYRVPIESLQVVTPATASQGRLIVLLLDDVTLNPTMIARAREVAQRFVTRKAPEERGGVVLLSGGLGEMTSDPARLRQRVDALRQSIGLLPADQLGAHMLRAVDGIARSIIEAPEKRKAIVAIGSGWLLDSPVPLPSSGALDARKEWFGALRTLAVSDTTYYVIDPVGVGASRQSGSAGFSSEAGGYAFLNTNDFNGAVDRILRETSNYYVIRVGDPPVGRKADLRDLDLRVKRPGITVRARRSLAGLR